MTDDARVERVARAIYGDMFPDRPDGWPTEDAWLKGRYRDTARAALAAAEPQELTDEQANHVANLCDIALQDALIASPRHPGALVYDGEVFAKSLAGNGYRIVPLQPPSGGDNE